MLTRDYLRSLARATPARPLGGARVAVFDLGGCADGACYVCRIVTPTSPHDAHAFVTLP